ncbi:hypothetical protein [Brevibacillus brevis]|uniref:Uncharacterized protein n=1 Tax=Brevibacillus brevis TaxID=1393 RepID=A0ABY9SWL1_BREBE|nr:hypothetical protein [Brevibacillus brevis]WNC12205.1 hypothetical protein RGB73_15790 [Brevibacillus brevis]
MFYRVSLILLLFCTIAFPAAAARDIGSIRVDPTLARSWQELVKRSDWIVAVKADASYRAFATGRSIREGKLVNYVQTLQVTQTIKGAPSASIKMVSTGVDPLPDARSPLNQIYPGPLAEGSYLLFLHRVQGTDLSSTVGLWQGVYPLHLGKTVALQGAGFAELNQLTVDELAAKVKAVSR